MKTIYKVLDCEGPYSLSDKINENVDEGWKVAGDLKVTVNQYKMRYTQRMSKEVPVTFFERHPKIYALYVISIVFTFFGVLTGVAAYDMQRKMVFAGSTYKIVDGCGDVKEEIIKPEEDQWINTCYGKMLRKTHEVFTGEEIWRKQ